MEIIDLFNVKDGFAHRKSDERRDHPNAEYFTADIKPSDADKLFDSDCDFKQVTLTFRNLVTVKNGQTVDRTSICEEVKYVAAIHNGNFVLMEDKKTTASDTVLGVCIGLSADL